MSQIRLMTVPVLSTTHVREEDLAWLEKEAAGNGGPWILCARISDIGFLVWADEDAGVPENPKAITDLCRWARAHGYDWFRLDCDAEVIDGLPVYEHR